MSENTQQKSARNAEAKTQGGQHKSEEALIEARRNKAALVRERGANPFANDVDAESRSFLADVRKRFEAARVTSESGESSYDADEVARIAAAEDDPTHHVMGRLVARRGFGKAAFLKLRDDTGELQLFAKKDEMGDAFSALGEIDIADHFEARGSVMVTKTGELSLLVKELRLLTKALRPLPDKWHGLSDVERRYRRRYVDLVANPEVSVALRARSIIIQGLRDFLDSRGFLEVETPTLHSLIGGAAAEPFVTHHNTLDMSLFLRIAPELYLKRLMVGGFERVYELGRCYRNEGTSTRHNPEFTILEFYQAYATYETLMPLTEELFRHVDGFLRTKLEAMALGDQYKSWVDSRRFTLKEAFARVPMRDAIQQALRKAGLEPTDVLPHLAAIAKAGENVDAESDGGAAERVASWAKASERSKSIDWGNLRKGLGGCETEGERIFLLYEYVAEPFLAEDYRSQDGKLSLPVFIMDYPREVSPLARRKDTDPTLTDRFELFVDGIERCNAFSELNDPDDQAQRFREQVEKKTRGAAETMDYDEDYIRALEHGMPPAAGFGLGVDRLVMMLTGQASIRDVVAFPLLRPEAHRQ